MPKKSSVTRHPSSVLFPYLQIKMSFKFEKLIVWQQALALTETVNEMVKVFPKEELFVLTSQIKRAADSVVLNIAEGSILQTNPENRKFVSYAIRSLAEVVACLHIAKKRNLIENVKFDEAYQKCFQLMNRLVSYRNAIQDR